MKTDLQKFIESKLTNVKASFFGVDEFKFYNLELKTRKIGFLGGGIHRHTINELYLNGKLIRKFINDYSKMLEVVETYGKLKLKSL